MCVCGVRCSEFQQPGPLHSGAGAGESPVSVRPERSAVQRAWGGPAAMLAQRHAARQRHAATRHAARHAECDAKRHFACDAARHVARDAERDAKLHAECDAKLHAARHDACHAECDAKLHAECDAAHDARRAECDAKLHAACHTTHRVARPPKCDAGRDTKLHAARHADRAYAHDAERDYARHDSRLAGARVRQYDVARRHRRATAAAAGRPATPLQVRRRADQRASVRHRGGLVIPHPAAGRWQVGVPGDAAVADQHRVPAAGGRAAVRRPAGGAAVRPVLPRHPDPARTVARPRPQQLLQHVVRRDAARRRGRGGRRRRRRAAGGPAAPAEQQQHGQLVIRCLHPAPAPPHPRSDARLAGRPPLRPRPHGTLPHPRLPPHAHAAVARPAPAPPAGVRRHGETPAAPVRCVLARDAAATARPTPGLNVPDANTPRAANDGPRY